LPADHLDEIAQDEPVGVSRTIVIRLPISDCSRDKRKKNTPTHRVHEHDEELRSSYRPIPQKHTHTQTTTKHTSAPAMSSSMRNAVQRRQHRERAQPLERAKYGLLEKHKDYSLRAADHKKKQATLKNLRAKVADKNEDEFYFGMMSRKGPVRGAATSSKGRKWDGIVDGDRGSLKGMDVDVSRLLKTQDLGYLRTARNVGSKEVRLLEERVVALRGQLEGAGVSGSAVDGDDSADSDDGFAGLDDRPRRRKYVFAEDLEDRDDMVMQLEEQDADGHDHDAMSEDSDDHRHHEDAQPRKDKKKKSRKQQLAATPAISKQEAEKLRIEQKRLLLGKLERRLEGARRKVAVLARAENKLELQRASMAKTPTASGRVTKAGKKIKIRERKR